MTPIIGSILISLALGLAGICVLCFSIFLKTKNYSYFLAGWRCSLSISILVIFSTILLLNELITSNFDISYVAHYTSYETPIFYKFTALWAIIAIVAACTCCKHATSNETLSKWGPSNLYYGFSEIIYFGI